MLDTGQLGVMTATRTILFLLVAVMSDLTDSFNPTFSSAGNSSTHCDITQRAILRKTAEVCRDIAASEGRDFTLMINESLSAAKVQRACFSPGTATSLVSTHRFQISICSMCLSNANGNVMFEQSEEHHFNSETFQRGRDIITAGVLAVKAAVRREDFVNGRLTLGRICHTLQDFYSHSNWVELTNNAPYSTLIQPDQPLTNLAGKCSHGGSSDKTSKVDPIGGINKDNVESSHGFLHHKACDLADLADLAELATMELLEDIRVAVGDNSFLRLMGVSQSSSLCFVIDTTGSMRDDIAEAKRVSFAIIDSKKGTQQEPSAYILVPFNDPDFGPAITTTNANVFKDQINKLSAKGGGDLPEMCLSGLQLALTAAPPSSEIFVFTDAPAKDADLKNTITALIESTKSVVTFMLTDVLPSRRRRRSSQSVFPRVISQSDAQLYRDLAQLSGGQAIEVTKSDLPHATTIIEDSLAGAVVTVCQEIRDPGRPDNFTFALDGSLTNVTTYITGASSLTFTLTSSKGVSQSSTQASGPLATFTTVGNLFRFSLNTDNNTGIWQISVNSNNPYSVKVIGQSLVNFIHTLVEALEGGHKDLRLKEGRPLSGGNFSLLICVTESETVNITDVTLLDSSGSTEVNGSLQVTDTNRPMCQEVTTSDICPSSSSLCASSQWEFVAILTDGINGTGIESVTIRQGNGTLNTSTQLGPGGENITVVTYRASCCSQKVELAAVDGVGNVRKCAGQARKAGPSIIVLQATQQQPAQQSVPATTAATVCSRGRKLSSDHAAFISVIVSVFMSLIKM